MRSLIRGPYTEKVAEAIEEAAHEGINYPYLKVDQMFFNHLYLELGQDPRLIYDFPIYIVEFPREHDKRH